MNLPDFINGVFEAGIGCLSWLNVRALARDKVLKGVHWGITAWAGVWGLYNLYYYPHLHQWWSFTGGLVIVAGNLTWLSMVCYYATKGKFK
jgi:hypothetical protein